MADTIIEELGIDPESLDSYEAPNSAAFSLGFFQDDTGTTIAGISYCTDYRAEEEYGTRDLRNALTSTEMRRFQMTDQAARHIAIFDDVCGLVLSTYPHDVRTMSWGDVLPSGSQDYVQDYTRRLPWVQGLSTNKERLSVKQLRALAKSLGLSPLPATKDRLLDAINTHPSTLASATHPYTYPAWFRYGRDLVLRADAGPTKIVLERLIEAARAGTLGIGNGSGAFSTGLFVYDTRDETPELVAAREAAFDIYDARMLELAPVSRELNERGYKFHFLGNPRSGGLKTVHGQEDGTTRYWLNGSTKRGHKYLSLYGWYTLDELLAEKFIAEAVEREALAR